MTLSQVCILRLHSRCAPMYGKCRLLSKNFWIGSAYDVTDSRSMTSYADSIYLWKVHDIFRALERIESKQPFYTTLPSTIRGVYTTLPSTIRGVYTTLPSTISGVYTTLPSTIRGVYTTVFSKLLSDHLFGKILEFCHFSVLKCLELCYFSISKNNQCSQRKKTWISINSYLIRQSFWFQIVNKWRVRNYIYI